MSDLFGFPEYIKIKQLKDMEKHLADFAVVVATEKVHGTNARFGLVDDAFVVGSRNNLLGPNEKVKDNAGFYAWAITQEQHLRDAYPGVSDIVIYGEWYGPGVQNEIKYCENKKFIVFDIIIRGYRLNWDGVVEVAKTLEYESVPVVYEGPWDKEVLRPFTTCESAIALRNGFSGQPTEGVVIRPKNTYLMNDGLPVIVKYKNPKFSELRSEKSGKTQVSIEGLDDFVAEYCTDERLTHVLGHLGDNPNIGEILREMNTDVQTESNGEWQKVASDWKQLSRGIMEATKVLMKERGIL